MLVSWYQSFARLYAYCSPSPFDELSAEQKIELRRSPPTKVVAVVSHAPRAPRSLLPGRPNGTPRRSSSVVASWRRLSASATVASGRGLGIERLMALPGREGTRSASKRFGAIYEQSRTRLSACGVSSTNALRTGPPTES